MHRTLLCLALLVVASSANAQVPHKKACDFLTQADLSAVLGRTVGAPRLPPAPFNDGRACVYDAPAPGGRFNISVAYTDVPDAEAVAKFLKATDTQTFFTATPVPGLGDAAFFSHLGVATKGSLTVFVGGTMTLSLTVGTLEQLRAVAEKALRGSGATGFAYDSGSAVPALSKPATPSTASTSPPDQLKLDLAKRAEAGDASAASALGDLYQYGNRGNGLTKLDYPAAMYWYKRASDRGVARASYELATMYHEGTAGAVNDDAAKELFAKAADAGYVPAMFPLASLYAARHDAVGQRRAIDWAIKSSQGNDPLGHLLMGTLWEGGQLSFDASESGKNALTEYGKAANQGNCNAMLNLGRLYFNGGHGVEQDASQAQVWSSRAESCFGKQFADMQAQAARYRSLAAAGHLPVPPAPATQISGSRFFTRKSSTQPPELSASGHDILAGMVGLAALGLAYAIAHPEQISAPVPDDNTYQKMINCYHSRGQWSQTPGFLPFCYP